MKAPHFSLPDQNNKVHSLSDYSGNWLVVYFYPKDETPACTKEACSFRDASPELDALGVKIVGISKDPISLHKKFETTHSLNFPLLSDPDHKTIEAFGAWQPKKFMGRQFMGTHRNTYIISPNGEIVKEYKLVNPLTHTQHVLSDLQSLIE